MMRSAHAAQSARRSQESAAARPPRPPLPLASPRVGSAAAAHPPVPLVSSRVGSAARPPTSARLSDASGSRLVSATVEQVLDTMQGGATQRTRAYTPRCSGALTPAAGHRDGAGSFISTTAGLAPQRDVALALGAAHKDKSVGSGASTDSESDKAHEGSTAQVAAAFVQVRKTPRGPSDPPAAREAATRAHAAAQRQASRLSVNGDDDSGDEASAGGSSAALMGAPERAGSQQSSLVRRLTWRVAFVLTSICLVQVVRHRAPAADTCHAALTRPRRRAGDLLLGHVLCVAGERARLRSGVLGPPRGTGGGSGVPHPGASHPRPECAAGPRECCAAGRGAGRDCARA